MKKKLTVTHSKKGLHGPTEEVGEARYDNSRDYKHKGAAQTKTVRAGKGVGASTTVYRDG